MIKYWLWLSTMYNLTPRQASILLDDFGGPENIYFADSRDFSGYRLPQAALDALADKTTERVDIILEQCERLGISLLTQQDAQYPGSLKQLYQPPIVLYYKGRLRKLAELPLITVVGSRSFTQYGVETASHMGYHLARQGIGVVSGMAKGIDGIAMRGALRAGGFTVAVLGSGADVIYPADNQDLYHEIVSRGLILTEYPPGTRAVGSNFPARNRIMAALGDATLVIEAGLTSGALITANLALETGRDVFCVPGPINSPESAGCNRLIQQGAGLVTDYHDIVEEYAGRYPHKLTQAPKTAAPADKPGRRTEPAPSEPEGRRESYRLPEGITDDKRLILLSLAEGPKSVDDLVGTTGLPTPKLLGELTLLEIEGLVNAMPGKRYSVVN